MLLFYLFKQRLIFLIFLVLLPVDLIRAALELGHYRVDRMIVHRLDMATSGCVIMARTDEALKDLNRQACTICVYYLGARDGKTCFVT